MKNVQVSKAEMLKRTARFTELRSSRQAFIDSQIPGHEREIFNVIGRGVTEDTTLNPAITDARDFNLTYVRAEPGKGAGVCGALRRVGNLLGRRWRARNHSQTVGHGLSTTRSDARLP